MNQKAAPPIVLCCSGSDPSGGAGIEADIASVLSLGCHPAPVITAITVQNSAGLIDFKAVDVGLFIEQMRAVLADAQVCAIKIGMVASVQIAEALHTILKDYPNIPVVLDPVLMTGFGQTLTPVPLMQVMKSLLFELATVITPNAGEARELAPEADTLSACGQALLDLGCEYVLITGADEPTQQVKNLLYSNRRVLVEFKWPRIEGNFHGSGCTLAAAIAALLAQGSQVVNAVQEAQKYTWESIKHGYKIGENQWIPHRLYWAIKAN